MPSLQLTIPAQDSDRANVKIKPREVRTWLHNLPYLDLKRTARLASQQLRLMNRQSIPPLARLEILGDFLGTHHRLTEALPPTRAEAEAIQPVLKRLGQDIGFGYKIVVNELANKRRGFMETRNLPLALLGSIHTLGLQLIGCWAAYRRAPRALWSECLALYAYARQIGRAAYRAELPGAGTIQIDESFRLIALLRLADPYHLAPGMIPALQQYFAPQIKLSRIENEQKSDKRSFPLLNTAKAGDQGKDSQLFLNPAALMKQMEGDIAKLERYQQSQALGLPPEVPARTLLHSLRQILDLWQVRRERSEEREETNARLELVNGLDSAYCMVNRGRCFDPSLFLAPDNEDVIDLGAPRSPDGFISQNTPTPLQCVSLNRSGGGAAIRYRGPQQPHPRVGQLLALRRPGTGSSSGWVIAVCRWLVETESGSGFEMGFQYLAREPEAIVIRVMDSSGFAGEYQPALAAIQKRAQQRVHTLIARSGEAHVGAQLTVYDQAGHQYSARCVELLESGLGFERFIYQTE